MSRPVRDRKTVNYNENALSQAAEEDADDEPVAELTSATSRAPRRSSAGKATGKSGRAKEMLDDDGAQSDDDSGSDGTGSSTSSESESSEDEDAGFSRRKRKPAAKKPAAASKPAASSNTSSNRPRSAAGAGDKAGPKAGAAVAKPPSRIPAGAALSGSNAYDAFMDGRLSPEDLAARLLNKISVPANRDGGIIELINFVMRFCGAVGDVLPASASLADVDVVELAETAATSVAVDSERERSGRGGYPLLLAQVAAPATVASAALLPGGAAGSALALSLMGEAPPAGAASEGAATTAVSEAAVSALCSGMGAMTLAAATSAAVGSSASAKGSASASASAAASGMPAGAGAGSGATAGVAVGDPAVGLEGYFDTWGQEFPPLRPESDLAITTATAGAGSIPAGSATIDEEIVLAEGGVKPAAGGAKGRAAAKGKGGAGAGGESPRRRLAAFWLALVTAAEPDVLIGHDVDAAASAGAGAGAGASVSGLLDTLHDLLSRLAATPHRHLRHLATLSAMSIGHAVLLKARDVSAAGAAASRQLAAERAVLAKLEAAAATKKGPTAAASALAAQRAKVSQLDASSRSLADFTTAARSLTGAVVTEVFSNRYRDISPDVRAEALLWFGRWLPLDRETLLSNTTLKYLGWMLNDGGSHVVRRLALQSVSLLYATVPDAPLRLREFTARFRRRIAEMTRDAAPTVAAAAATLMRQAFAAQHLLDDNIAELYERIADDSLQVRRAAATVLLDYAQPFKEEVEAAEAATAAGEADGEDGDGDGDEHGASAGAGSAGKRGGKAAATAAAAARAARAAAAAAAATRRRRRQLRVIVELAASLLPEAYNAALSSERLPADVAAVGGDGGAARAAARALLRDAAFPLADRIMDRVLSAFWGHPRAAALASAPALADLLLHSGSGIGGGAGDDSSGGSAGAGSEVEDDGVGALPPLQQHLALRLLAGVASRMAGDGLGIGSHASPAGDAASHGGLDGSAGVPIMAGAANTKGKGAGAKGKGSGAGADADDAAADALAAPVAVAGDGPDAGLSAFALSTAPEDVAAARHAFSAALLPFLPQLLARYGGGETVALGSSGLGAGSAGGAASAAALASVIRSLAPSAFAAPRAGKAFADTVYHVSRLLTRHAAVEPLGALTEALAALASDGARAREAEGKVRTLLSQLAARLPPLVAAMTAQAQADESGDAADGGKAAGKGGKGGKGAKAAKGRSAKGMQQDEGEDEDGTAGAGGSSSSGASAAARDLPSTFAAAVAIMRRLRLLLQRIPSAAALLPEALGPEGSVAAAVSTALRHSRRLVSLFTAASAASASAAGGASAAGASPVAGARGGALPLDSSILGEGLALLAAIYTASLHGLAREAHAAAESARARGTGAGSKKLSATAAAAAAAEAAAASLDREAVAAVSSLRESLTSHLRATLALRHPAPLLRLARRALTAAAAAAAASDGASGGDGPSAQSQALPAAAAAAAAAALVDEELADGPRAAVGAADAASGAAASAGAPAGAVAAVASAVAGGGILPGLESEGQSLYPIDAARVPLVERAYIVRARGAAFAIAGQLASLCARACGAEASALAPAASLNIDALVDGLLLHTRDVISGGAGLLAAAPGGAPPSSSATGAVAGGGGVTEATVGAAAVDLAVRGLFVPQVSPRVEALLAEALAAVSGSASSSASSASSSSGAGAGPSVSRLPSRARSGAVAALVSGGGASGSLPPRWQRPLADLEALSEYEPDLNDLPVSALTSAIGAGGSESGAGAGAGAGTSASMPLETGEQVVAEWKAAFGGELDLAAAAAAGEPAVPLSLVNALRASAALTPLAATSLCFPMTARISSALTSRGEASTNEAGEAGALIVARYARLLRSRSPHAWLLSDLQTMAETVRELSAGAAAAAAMRESGEEEAAADAEAALAQRLSIAVAVSRRHIAALGVAGRSTAMAEALHAMLRRALEVGFLEAPSRCLIFAFAAPLLPFLPLAFQALLLKEADAAGSRATGHTGAAAAAALTQSLEWWAGVLDGSHDPYEGGRVAAPAPGDDGAEDGDSPAARSAQLRAWAPFFAFRRGLRQLVQAGTAAAKAVAAAGGKAASASAAKGVAAAAKAATRESVAAALVCLGLSIGDEEGGGGEALLNAADDLLAAAPGGAGAGAGAGAVGASQVAGGSTPPAGKGRKPAPKRAAGAAAGAGSKAASGRAGAAAGKRGAAAGASQRRRGRMDEDSDDEEDEDEDEEDEEDEEDDDDDDEPEALPKPRARGGAAAQANSRAKGSAVIAGSSARAGSSKSAGAGAGSDGWLSGRSGAGAAAGGANIPQAPRSAAGTAGRRPGAAAAPSSSSSSVPASSAPSASRLHSGSVVTEDSQAASDDGEVALIRRAGAAARTLSTASFAEIEGVDDGSSAAPAPAPAAAGRGVPAKRASSGGRSASGAAAKGGKGAGAGAGAGSRGAGAGAGAKGQQRRSAVGRLAMAEDDDEDEDIEDNDDDDDDDDDESEASGDEDEDGDDEVPPPRKAQSGRAASAAAGASSRAAAAGGAAAARRNVPRSMSDASGFSQFSQASHASRVSMRTDEEFGRGAGSDEDDIEDDDDLL